VDSSQFVEQIKFDREIPLDELIAAVDRPKLNSLLTYLLHGDFEIVGPQGECLLGVELAQTTHRQAIMMEIEPIGSLLSHCSDRQAQSQAMTCLMMQLRFAQKFLMASALHIEAIQEDYHTLCQEHEALLLSEAQYKSLSESLDDKVKEQVKTIESTQRQLFESDKLASVGHLAAGIAHEINNPLGFITSNLNTGVNYLNDFKKLGEMISQGQSMTTLQAFWDESDMNFVVEDFTSLMVDTLEGSQRVADIVADLKLFSNVDAEEELSVDINRYIKSSCNVAKASLNSGIELELIQQGEANLKCRPGYIGQVILALIMNANDVLSEQGQIKVVCRLEGKQFYVDVVDNGPGISEDLKSKVFDPFFTTKDVGQGKGLGLTSCRDIILAHSGEISISASSCDGTTISFWIPVIC
jgi:signal transduction histidine kinase